MLEANIQKIFDEVQSINIYENGSTVQLLPSQMGFTLVINGFKNVLANARQMPAFGVSLDNETRSAMAEGLWVEFDFGKRLTYAEMPFEKLLAQVVSSHSGFNLIRYNSKEGYAGRCYYFDIDGNLSAFYDILKSV